MQPAATQRFEIERALAYGHVAAALGTLRRIGLELEAAIPQHRQYLVIGSR
jgi:hypothetical protein